MAKKSGAAPGKTIPRKRKDRRPSIPAATVTNPVERPPADEVEQRPPITGLARKRPQRLTSGVPISANYHYVVSDLKNIGITSIVLIAGMGVLYYFIR